MSVQLSAAYFNNRIAIKLLKLSVSSVNAKAKLSTRGKTHYDTLKVSPNATHNEIKSAYYKLTLQYHPDKNKSDSAREMFQDISNAYEVIGNYQTRKQYDRSIAVKYGNVNQMQRPTATDSGTASPSSQVHYDFDEWTRAHYSSAFKTTQKKKYVYKMYTQAEKQAIKLDKQNRHSGILAIVICTCLITIMHISDRRKHTDIALDEKRD
ncbi:uncharacterized protein LOC143377153 [Andrena cerasifolii]|uniref:uncharacterized protein LOC143377153 n=1 Tax=Andrena cerasifolii TaxID=2819439 RepID=UPI004038331B